MGRKRAAGLYLRNGVWHIDKQYRGLRICESTGESELAKAEEFLTKRLDEARQARVFGIRPKRSFRAAATRYLNENSHKRSIATDAHHLKLVDPFIGRLSLDSVHMGTLQQFISARKRDGVKTKTINASLAVIRHLLNMAASEWLDDNNLTWLPVAPKIKLLKVTDAHKPYPLSWEEQTALFTELPAHLQPMALFKVNTGCRDGEVCSLRWDWEVKVEELDTSVFIIPDAYVKNGDERLVVLNRVAKSVVAGQRGKHPVYVFTYRGKPIETMNNSGWQHARRRVNLQHVRVHDLKHTFAEILRQRAKAWAHCSVGQLDELVDASNCIADKRSRMNRSLA
ncbi:MAG: tyrosine-type recombinase/integrase [Nitrosomonadales bacterium]|nr:tyrosine-type recombinase/integrase [Nitrosomonadales bacterium]